MDTGRCRNGAHTLRRTKRAPHPGRRSIVAFGRQDRDRARGDSGAAPQDRGGGVGARQGAAAVMRLRSHYRTAEALQRDRGAR